MAFADLQSQATSTLASELLKTPLFQRLTQIPIVGALFRNQTFLASGLAIAVFGYGTDILKAVWQAASWPVRALTQRKTRIETEKREDKLEKRLNILENEVHALSDALRPNEATPKSPEVKRLTYSPQRAERTRV